MMLNIFVLLIAFLIPSAALAGTYWVHPYGTAANYAACANATDPGGTCTEGNCANYCNYNTVNSSAVAGDVIYYKGGTYTVSGTGMDYEFFQPANNGAVGNVITFAKVAGETPIVSGNALTYAIYFSGKSYLKIDGFTIRDIPSWAYWLNSDHIEITNCTFTTTEGNEAKGGGIILQGTSTHNWIHANTMNGIISASGACSEGVDLIRIGTGYAIGNDIPGANYNTVEDNTLYSAAHTIIDNYGMYNVIRNNISHNEPWITGCTAGQTGKEIAYDASTSTVTIGTGDKTFTVSAGKSYPALSPIAVIRTADHTKAMQGAVKSYSGTTLVVTVAYVLGSGEFSDWTITKANFPQYETAGYDAKFGHRNFQLTDDYGREGTYVLLEGNRLGHASNNPGNGGPMNLDLAAPKNIVRYNDIFNGMSTGMYFKYASADLTSTITSSTENTIGTGEKTFTIATGLHLTTGQTIRIWNTADKTKAMTGTVTSYTSGTGALVVNIDDTRGSGTLSAWQIFWNGASGGVLNRIYNNTLYHNGNGYDWRAYGAENVAYSGQGIGQVNAAGEGSTGNIIKNNIVYDNKEGPICSAALYDGDSTTTQCSAEAWDTVSNNYTTDPTFTNADLSDATSTTLPDLTLQAASGAIGQGTYLTLANGAGTNSTTLIVDDALYFQDGTWGSSLSNIQADWIKVGTVTVQISSINYATNTITLASAISWADDAEIRLYKKSDGVQVLYGSETDMGAHEYAGATTYTVTPATSTGCVLTPAEGQVTDGTAVAFDVATAYGYSTTVSGCGGTLSGTTFTTDTVSGNCTVTCNPVKRMMEGIGTGSGTMTGIGTGSGVATLGD